MTTSTVSRAPTASHPAEEAMRADTTRLAVIVGSIRNDRFCPTPAAWIADQARKHEALEVQVIDLADYDLPSALSGNDPDAPQPEVVTPVYNRSYPASLKNAIDWFYPEWHLKPVGFVYYGGTFGGMESMVALREVFAKFDAVALSYSIAFPNFWETFDHDARPVEAERVAAHASRFLGELTWWAMTLREGRARRPYPANAAD